MEGFDARRASDQELLGLRRTGPTDATFELTPGLARMDGRLYGGTALAAAVAVTEMATDRPVVWSTVQFVSNEVQVGQHIDVTVEVLASGHRTSQVRTTARHRDQLVFAAMGSNALPKADAVTGVFPVMPAVPPPEECGPMVLNLPTGPVETRGRNPDMRIVRRVPGEREMLMWSRVVGRPATAAVQGYVADYVPMAVVNAAGRIGAGISLDNTLRTVASADTEWVLVQLIAHAAAGGFGTGEALLWSEDGTFLGVASQTSTAFAFD